jgi:hypothetical protein
MIKLQLHPEPRILAQFAWIAPLGFTLIALALHRSAGLPGTGAWIVAAVGVVVLLAHLLGARAVPLVTWRVLVVVAYPIGLVVFPLILGVVYYGVVTPIALCFRLAGRDSMERRLDPGRASYWRERGAPKPGGSYFQMY